MNTIKKTLSFLLLLLALTANSLQAKTIHWLTFIDTTDPNVGATDMNTRKILYGRWIDLVNASLKEEGYDSHIVDIYGSRTTPENCKNIVNNLKCGREDIVVFYYVGHGTENTETSRFPLMTMKKPLDINKFVPLSWVHDTLKKKGAKLTISIGMCCNGRQGVPGRIAPSFSVNYGQTNVSQAMSSALKKMFLDYTGDLIVSSSSPRELSYGCGSILGPTDFFTLNLLIQFNNVIPECKNPSWETLLVNIRREVSNAVRTDPGLQAKYPGATQTPHWSSNLRSATRPAKTKPTQPVPVNTNPNNEPITKATLDRVLSFITSTSVDVNQRIDTAEEFKSLFDTSLIVRMLSQDGEVVIDKEPVSSFLGRISTSRQLMNVSVVDYSLDANGRINALTVREVYKK